MGALDLLFGIRKVQLNGVDLLARTILNFKGAVAIVDDSANQRLNITVSGVVGVNVTDLFTRQGNYDKEPIVATGYSTSNPRGGGVFFWKSAPGLSHNAGTVVGTIGTGRWIRCYSGPLDATWFGCVGDGVTADDSARDLLTAVAMVTGERMHFPHGDYLFQTKWTIRPVTFYAAFGMGPRISGDGIDATRFVTKVANDAVIDIDSSDDADHLPFLAALGVELRGFSIIKHSSNPAACTGIKLRTCYMVTIEKFHINGMDANGIELVCNLGDVDASNCVSIRQGRIESCGKVAGSWGIKADATSGHNETSILDFENVFIEDCGVASGPTNPPTSGGMIWKGQTLYFRSGGFTLSNNCAFYCPGQAGLASSLAFNNVTIENTKGRPLYITGLNMGTFDNLTFHNNNTYVATDALCELDGSGAFLIRNVRFNNCFVRAQSNNQIPAFYVHGANAEVDSILFFSTNWGDFDYTGQSRFVGVHFPFIQQQCTPFLVNSDILRFGPAANFVGKGGVTPIRRSAKNAGAGGAASTTGEWQGVRILSNAYKALAPTVSGVSIKDLEGVDLAASTTYNVYWWDNNSVFTLSVSTTAKALDPESGYWVKSDDANKLYLCRIRTDGASPPKWDVTASGWLDPLLVPGTLLGTPANLWVDGSGKLRVKTTAPTSDTDGTIVGTQSQS
jgi:hypothetical protein